MGTTTLVCDGETPYKPNVIENCKIASVVCREPPPDVGGDGVVRYRPNVIVDCTVAPIADEEENSWDGPPVR
jgi:hypothetical protein